MKTFLHASLVCTKRLVCQHLLMITVLMLFAGASMGQNSTTLPDKKVEARPIRVHLGEGVQDLDPHLQVSRVGNFLVQNIFERLVTMDAERKPLPSLVDRWEVGDGNLLRLHLRPGVLFHDQTPLKAADVVASVERARNHPKSVVATHLSGIREVRPAGEEWVEVVGDREAGGLLAELADVLIAKADSCKADSWGAAGTAIGTGSFRVTRFQPGELLEVSTLAAHWQGPPAPKTVIYRVVPQEKERVQQLLAGEADLVFPLQPTSVEEIEEREDLWVEAQLSRRPHRRGSRHAIRSPARTTPAGPRPGHNPGPLVPRARLAARPLRSAPRSRMGSHPRRPCAGGPNQLENPALTLSPLRRSPAADGCGRWGDRRGSRLRLRRCRGLKC